LQLYFLHVPARQVLAQALMVHACVLVAPSATAQALPPLVAAVVTL